MFEEFSLRRAKDLIQIMGHEFNALPNPDNFFR